VFDLRYHVASLTAVFVALVIGILVGVGLSGKGFVNDAERANLNSQIADLRRERDDARGSLADAARGAAALKAFSDTAYPAVVPNRLDGRKIAVLFVGPVDRGTAFTVAKAVRDAGGTVVRTRSMTVPLDVVEVEKLLRRQLAFRKLVGSDKLGTVGGTLATELADGGKTPMWDALGPVIVQERDGPGGTPADGLVVIRTVGPQVGETKAFLQGLYEGLARTGVPAVGTEVPGTRRSAIPAFAKAGLSTVDSLDTSTGQLGLVLLLQGAEPGSYGMGETATTGVLPQIPPVTAPSQ
jgi:hypothetical protein